MMAQRHPVVFLLDVDNTLLDNDRVSADLKHYLTREVGESARSATGRSSRRSVASSATPTTSARFSAIGSNTPATPTCSRCPRFS